MKKRRLDRALRALQFEIVGRAREKGFMSVFAYTALSRDGSRKSGTLSAETRAAAISQVTQQGLHPVSIDESRDAAATARNARATPALPSTGKVPQSAVEAFTRELA